MAQKKQVRKRKTGQKILFLVLVVSAIVIGYLVYVAYFKDKEKTDSNKTVADSSAVIEIKEEKKVAESKVVTDSDNNTTKKEDGIEVFDESDPNMSESVTGYISSSGVNGDYYKIVVVTNQALSEGECSIELLGDNNYTGSSSIIAHPNSASCVFKFNKDEIANGDYAVRITVTTTGNRSGTIEGEVKK